ncbi:hypothetical protein ACLOJK_006633 [Asimina triloba]
MKERGAEVIYIHKAIMEMQPNQCILDDSTYDARDIWACGGVERGIQLAMGLPEQDGHEQAQDNEERSCRHFLPPPFITGWAGIT